MTEAIGGFSPNLSSIWPESPLYCTGHHRDPTSQGQRAPASTTTPSNPGLGDAQQISAGVNKLSLLWGDSLDPHADKQPSVHRATGRPVLKVRDCVPKKVPTTPSPATQISHLPNAGL